MILFLILFARVSSGQSVRISVRSAVEAAVGNHATVRIAKDRVAAAEAHLDEVGARMLPKVELTGRAFLLSDVEQATITLPVLPAPVTLFPVITHSYAARLQVTQPVFTGFRLSNAKAAAAHSAEAALADRTRDESQIALMTEKAYWGWVQAREAFALLEDMAGQMKEHESRIQRLADQGLARASDVLNIRVRRSEIDVKAIEARTVSSMAMMRLNSLMGMPLGTDLIPEERPDQAIVDVPDDADDLVTHAIDARPDLASARLRTEMAKTGVSLAGAAWYPNIGFAAAYEYANPNQRIIPPRDKFDGSWQVGLTFQWTVWDWMTTSSKTAQATAKHRQAEAGYALMLDGMRLEVAQLWRKVEDSKEIIRSTRLSFEAAEESFRIMEKQYDEGLATPVDVTDARVEVLRAKLELSQAATGAAIARAELRHAIGEDR
jgi:outer membrane protein TolC